MILSLELNWILFSSKYLELRNKLKELSIQWGLILSVLNDSVNLSVKDNKGTSGVELLRIEGYWVLRISLWANNLPELWVLGILSKRVVNSSVCNSVNGDIRTWSIVLIDIELNWVF